MRLLEVMTLGFILNIAELDGIFPVFLTAAVDAAEEAETLLQLGEHNGMCNHCVMHLTAYRNTISSEQKGNVKHTILDNLRTVRISKYTLYPSPHLKFLFQVPSF